MSSENSMPPAASGATQDAGAIEPIDTSVTSSTTTSSTEQKRSTTPRPGRDSSTSSTRTTKKLHPKRAPSATNSPIPSREPSPVRPSAKPTSSSSSSSSNRPPGPGRPRKNSSQDVSPSRSSSTSTNPPSAAATQRALSATSIPTLYPSLSESTIKAPIPQKPSVTSEFKDIPRWPISPRLRSPPPINKPSIISPRKIENELPAINVHRSLQTVEQQEGKQGALDSETEDSLSLPGMRTPARGASGASSTLETVQEISQPNTPARGLDGTSEKTENGSSTEQDASNASGKGVKPKPSLVANESGSDSGNKGKIEMRTTSIPPMTTLRPSAPAVKSFTTGTGRGKPPGEGTTRNMTVETETVSSIPQVAVGGPAGNGSLRAKPSSETIRPKKEKKKTARKTPSVTSGTGEHPNSSRPRLHHHPSMRDFSYPSSARSPDMQYGQGPSSSSNSSGAASPERQSAPASRRPSLSIQSVSSLLTRTRPASSKADIFEAKVASAVDEANSSDSEETFVYESNPPDAADRPRRYHSRTPSATSMASQIDQRNGPRSAIDGGHSVAMKKSMKFAHSFASNGQDSTTGDDDGKGTARSNMGTGRGTTHHHHIGRWGRNGGNGHASLFDNESPFPNAAKSKFSGSASKQSSQPTSPRLSNSRMSGNGKRSSPITAGYDLDEAADDERTPLISSVRSGRSGRGRRPLGSSMRQLEHQASRENRSFLARFAGCLVLSFMIVLVFLGAIGFMFATTQPLTNVNVLALKNVLASEQDVIFDMKVEAKNPNIVAVTVEMADMVIFAKSKYAGTDSEWWSKPHPGDKIFSRRGLYKKRDDDPQDPPLNDDPNTNPNLEIGHVYKLDSPLTFEGSPFNHAKSESIGQIRVNHPGNKTIPAGSERWGRVLQHEFDLIIRGTLKYTLPLSQRVRSISVEGRVAVKPNAADQDPDTVHIITGLSAGEIQSG
ncbi:hypothetical protein G7Y89_g1084 [Cudoniella acicularis]|uniref:Phospholipid metabolism enzyme regulator n=1 Tax=Cudoniella acicularis TaxID=354080 RepID=A0A8H4W7Q9_9HELO|nr:hypothetical protein G7Y89_g1084 [Cudoniella acicularis]